MQFDPMEKRFPSKRNTIYTKRGVVATSQPLAAKAGAEILRKGGNAVDAAVATAAALTVVEPTSNGIGSDAFAIVWLKDKLYGLNSSGPSPKGISIESVKAQGHEEMPKYGWTPVNVPGAPKAWASLVERFGNLSLAEVLAPAIDYAENGYVVNPALGYFWQRACQVYRKKNDPLFEEWFRVFAPGGEAPEVGDVVTLPDHGQTLRRIGETGGESFYKGDLADTMDKASKAAGGYLRKADLEAFEPEWVEPVKVSYKGYDVWELPPNGQGIIALMGLNMMKHLDVDHYGSVQTLHKQFEVMKLAFSDGLAFITDPDHMEVTVDQLLSESYGKERTALIGDLARDPEPGEPQRSGTVYLATADAEGNMVSYIQSNYMGFGSGVVVPGTGISLQNRGNTFSLDPEKANALAPGKRTYHTIIPGFLTKGNEPLGPFGIMGGYMQPQAHMQVVMNLVNFHMNPQDALDAPRWQWVKGKAFQVEAGLGADVVRSLKRKGHEVSISPDEGPFGRGQMILKQKNGVYAVGTESRTDGYIAIE